MCKNITKIIKYFYVKFSTIIHLNNYLRCEYTFRVIDKYVMIFTFSWGVEYINLNWIVVNNKL